MEEIPQIADLQSGKGAKLPDVDFNFIFQLLAIFIIISQDDALHELECAWLHRGTPADEDIFSVARFSSPVRVDLTNWSLDYGYTTVQGHRFVVYHHPHRPFDLIHHLPNHQ